MLDVYPSWAWMDGWMMTMRSMHLVFFCADDVHRNETTCLHEIFEVYLNPSSLQRIRNFGNVV